MTNRKKTRARARGVPPSQAPRAGTRSTAPVAPPTPGGPNRLARKEEARRQRESIKRRMARRRVLRVVGIVAVVALVAAGVSAYLVLKPSAAADAGCGPVRVIRPYPGDPTLDRTHIGPTSAITAPPPLSTYASIPPTSGPHNPSPLPAGVYDSPQPVDRMIHSLEHGAVIIWYRPGNTSPALQEIKSFYQQPSEQDHVIVAPYSYPDQGAAGVLPAGQAMVMDAWHHLQSCATVSLGAAKGFVGGYRTPTGIQDPSGYRGDAPEPGLAIS